MRYDVTLNGILSSSTEARQFTFRNLSPGTSYNITVAGVNGVGRGPANSISVQTARRPGLYICAISDSIANDSLLSFIVTII